MGSRILCPGPLTTPRPVEPSHEWIKSMHGMSRVERARRQLHRTYTYRYSEGLYDTPEPPDKNPRLFCMVCVSEKPVWEKRTSAHMVWGRTFSSGRFRHHVCGPCSRFRDFLEGPRYTVVYTYLRMRCRLPKDVVNYLLDWVRASEE